MQVAFHKHVCSEGNQDWKHRASAAWLLESCLSGLGMVGIMKCCKICGEDVFSFTRTFEINSAADGKSNFCLKLLHKIPLLTKEGK